MAESADWRVLKDLFAELVELGADDRAHRLTAISSTDAGLAARLVRLLDADAAADPRLAVYEAAPSGSTASAPGAPADPLGLVGRTVAHFQVLEVLGTGGMGVAYRALDGRLGRTVALKFLLPSCAPDEAARDLLLHEARAASSLDHPNVCTVLEVGECDAGLFFAMPAYAGETLKQHLGRSGALPIPFALDITCQLLRGLEAAHAASIIHRDLKPGNLIVTADGTLKILDFGIARVRDLQFTAAGSVPGTVAYMSPEQLSGGEIDHRTDLWSAGAVLYEMLTGSHPFGSGGTLSSFYSILHEAPPAPSTLRPELPRELDAIVAGLLRRDPDQRPPSAGAVLADVQRLAATAAAPAPPHRRVRARRRLLVTVLILAAVFAAASPLVRGTGWGGRAAPDEATGSIAVLPFVDTSPAREQDHLGDGFAEEMMDALAGVDGLTVTARSSAFAFRNTDVPLQQIARRLGVGTILDGSVHHYGDSVRITARLVHAASGRPLWTNSFAAAFSEIFVVQSEIATAVAAALVGDAPITRSQPTQDPRAYELYLRGLFHWNRRSPQDLARALDFFQQAIRHDSQYARAYAGLALTYAVLPIMEGSAGAMLDLAHAAADRALAIDPSLAEAHAARAYAYHWQWRWADAEREFERAIALKPDYSTVYQWYGEHLAKMGRSEEGERMMRRAIALDPLSLVAQNDLGIVFLLARRYDDAIAQLELVHRADPSMPLPLLLLHRVHLLAGNAADAADAGRRWAEQTRAADPADMALLARASRDAALRADALAALTRWEHAAAPRWSDIALYHTLLHERERAVHALEQALSARSPMLAQLGAAEWVDPLRDDPRVAAILKELAFPQFR